MNSIAKQVFNEFCRELGAELKRVRTEQNLTVEEASALFNRPHPSVIANIESGCSNRFFLIFALCALYKKHLKIELID